MGDVARVLQGEAGPSGPLDPDEANLAKLRADVERREKELEEKAR